MRCKEIQSVAWFPSNKLRITITRSRLAIGTLRRCHMQSARVLVIVERYQSDHAATIS